MTFDAVASNPTDRAGNMTDAHELTIDAQSSGEKATVYCRGKLTLMSAPDLRREVKRLLPSARVVTIDFTNVTLLDSVGLGAIAALYASARAAGCELQLVNISPRIRELFSVTRILSLFEPCGEANVRMT
jgi:anti-sigma B factor antagonist